MVDLCTVADERPAEVNIPYTPVTAVDMATTPKSSGESNRERTAIKIRRNKKLAAWPQSFANPLLNVLCFRSRSSSGACDLRGAASPVDAPTKPLIYSYTF